MSDTKTTAQQKIDRTEYRRKYYKVNREMFYEHSRKYREVNREEIRERDRKYRAANPEKIREANKKYRETHREQIRDCRRKRQQKLHTTIIQYLRKHPCINCGEADMRCLEFHHLTPVATRDAYVATLITRAVSHKRIQEEIDKCVVLCGNCHMKRHGKNGVLMNSARKKTAAVWRIEPGKGARRNANK